MRLMLEQGALESREIAAACGLSSPSLAGVLARMDARGLVRRERVRADRRRLQVSFTPEGQRLAERLVQSINEAHAVLAAKIGPATIEKVAIGLEQLIGALES